VIYYLTLYNYTNVNEENAEIVSAKYEIPNIKLVFNVTHMKRDEVRWSICLFLYLLR